MFNVTGPLAFSDSELTFETKNPSRYFVRNPWARDQRNRTTQHRKSWAYIHVSIGIETHDFNFRAVQDQKRLRPHGHCHRLLIM